MVAWVGFAAGGLRGKPPDPATIETWAANLIADARFQAAVQQATYQADPPLVIEAGGIRAADDRMLLELSKMHGADGDYLLISERLPEQLAPQSVDSVTALPDRHALDAAIARLEGGDRLGGALVFLDVDDFKQINDVHGHLAGDHVLHTLGERWRRELRRGDFLGRFGGDEFVALLSDVSGQQAAAVSGRLVETAAQPIEWKQSDLQVTVSAGIAMLADHSTVEHALHAADRAMYLGKSQRRDEAR